MSGKFGEGQHPVSLIVRAIKYMICCIAFLNVYQIALTD